MPDRQVRKRAAVRPRRGPAPTRLLLVRAGGGGRQADTRWVFGERELGGVFEPYRFTRQSRDFLVDNAVYLVEKELVELPIEPDRVRRAFTNVQEGEDGYEHASGKHKDVFDAVAMALSEVKSGKGRRSMEILSADRSVARRALRKGRSHR